VPAAARPEPVRGDQGAANAWAYVQDGISRDIRDDPPVAAAVEGQALAVAATAARLAGRRIAPRDPEVRWTPQWHIEDPTTGLGGLWGMDLEQTGRPPDAWAISVLVHLEPERVSAAAQETRDCRETGDPAG
jgi:hypothetical protein